VLGGGATATLAIRRDAHSDFFQWFHFRVSGAQGRQLVLKITGLTPAPIRGLAGLSRLRFG
jgi:hypothetical protein